MNEFMTSVFGGYSWGQLLVFAWFFFIGYALFALYEIDERDKKAKVTPFKFSFEFFMQDNWRRYVATILTTYVFFRFYTEFMQHPLTEFECLMIGLIGDGIGAKMKRKIKGLQANRVKLMDENA